MALFFDKYICLFAPLCNDALCALSAFTAINVEQLLGPLALEHVCLCVHVCVCLRMYVNMCDCFLASK